MDLASDECSLHSLFRDCVPAISLERNASPLTDVLLGRQLDVIGVGVAARVFDSALRMAVEQRPLQCASG